MTLEKRVYVIGGVAAVALVLAVVGASIVFRHAWRWGDFPSWITAITTTLVFAAAAVATRVAYRLYKVESGRDLAAAEDRRLAAEDRKRAEDERAERREADRRTQANKVAGWLDSRESTRGGGRMREQGAFIRNASDLPILDVKVAFYFAPDPGAGQPWEPTYHGEPAGQLRVIPPGVDRFIAIPEQTRNLVDEVYVVGIEFSDAAGNRWERDGRGALNDA